MGWPMALGLPHYRTCRFTFQWTKIIFGKWTTYRRDDLPVNHGEIDQSKQLNMAINGFDFQGLVRSQQPQLVKSCVAQVLGHGIRTSLAVSTRAAATTDDNSGNDGFHEFLTWFVWLNMTPQDSAFKWVNWWSTIWFWYMCGMAWEMLPSLFGTSNLFHPPQNLWDSHHVEVAMHPWYSARFLCFFSCFSHFSMSSWPRDCVSWTPTCVFVLSTALVPCCSVQAHWNAWSSNPRNLFLWLYNNWLKWDYYGLSFYSLS